MGTFEFLSMLMKESPAILGGVFFCSGDQRKS